jgi:ubiquinone/menaquinone biosynthesis C-methylase UbiE
LLTKNGAAYGLTPEVETYLVQGKEKYLGPMIQHTDLLWPTFGRLTEAVRTGQPQRAVDEEAQGEEFFVQLVPMIFTLTYPQARAAAAGLGVGDGWTGLTVLDVGAGSGAWSLAMLERDPTARSIAVDWPPVLEVTKQFAQRFGLADRYEYLAGNLREVDFGEACCDLAILGHICHTEGAENSQRLFRRLHRALRPGGKLLIADMIPDEERRSAVFPLLFAINMLVHSVSGDTFTQSEYTTWLRDAGFTDVWTLENPGPSPLLVAEK